jgi:hypothetical protein
MATEPRSRFGLNALKARVKVRGLEAIARHCPAVGGSGFAMAPWSAVRNVRLWLPITPVLSSYEVAPTPECLQARGL